MVTASGERYAAALEFAYRTELHNVPTRVALRRAAKRFEVEFGVLRDLMRRSATNGDS